MAEDEYSRYLIRLARMRAKLTQAELARRAGTSQATISAYESGRKSPTVATLSRLLRASGFDLRARIEPHDDHDEVLAEQESQRSPEERERWRAAQSRFVAAAARARVASTE